MESITKQSLTLDYTRIYSNELSISEPHVSRSLSNPIRLEYTGMFLLQPQHTMDESFIIMINNVMFVCAC